MTVKVTYTSPRNACPTECYFASSLAEAERWVEKQRQDPLNSKKTYSVDGRPMNPAS